MTIENSKTKWSIVVAANSDDILQTNLLGSGETKLATEVVVQRHATSAAVAYNAGLTGCSSDLVVFAHQDVFLPAGWAKVLGSSIERLSALDPQWGVAGVFGMTVFANGVGHIYSTGLRRFVGDALKEPIPVRSLDEMVLIIRQSSGLKFDERLPGFHLYGTDICLEAEARGLRNYVLPCFSFHNSCGAKRLPMSFWQAYLYLRKKWKDRLPIVTPCTKITVGCTPIIDSILRKGWLTLQGKNKPGYRVADPKLFYMENLLPLIEGDTGSIVVNNLH
jgi:hypothetical protein